MIQNTAEIMKGNNKESVDMQSMEQEVKQMVSKEQMEGAEAEEMKRSLELQLMEAQAAHERKEEAERHGKETKEKVAELTG